MKWWPTQQAFPRSAILTEMVSKPASSFNVSFECLLDLSRLIPETSLVNNSLPELVRSQEYVQAEVLTRTSLVASAHLPRHPHFSPQASPTSTDPTREGMRRNLEYNSLECLHIQGQSPSEARENPTRTLVDDLVQACSAPGE